MDGPSGTGIRNEKFVPAYLFLATRWFTEYLVHACKCKYANCTEPNCLKYKLFVQQILDGKPGFEPGSPAYRHLMALCCVHSQQCEEGNCCVPFCASIKSKLRLNKSLERSQNDTQHSQILNESNLPASIENFAMVLPEVIPPPTPFPTQASKQLHEVLKSPSSAHQRQQVLAILKANPKIMISFIKARAARVRQQQQEQFQHQQTTSATMEPPSNANA